MYANGLGVERDDVQAVDWYGKAAEQGHALAQFNLGGMYGAGRGVKRDALQSFMWLTLSAQAGDVTALSNRRKLKLVMTPQSVQAGLELARKWRRAHPAAAVAHSRLVD